jgi:hypothetical protein
MTQLWHQLIFLRVLYLKDLIGLKRNHGFPNLSDKNDEDIQNKDDFIRYFENINNHSDKIPNSNFHNSIISHMNQMLEKLMGKNADDTFNEPIQPNEILKTVKTLKNGIRHTAPNGEHFLFALAAILNPKW